MAEQSVSEWMTAVEKELGLEGAIASDQGLDPVDDLGDQVERQVGAAAVRRTAFLVGVAAGRAEQPAVAAQDFAQKGPCTDRVASHRAWLGLPSCTGDLFPACATCLLCSSVTRGRSA